MHGRRPLLRASWQWLLALVLLLTQQAGMRHELKHLGDQDLHAAHTLCCECLAHHASDHTVATGTMALPLISAPQALRAEPAPASRWVATQTVYLSRAPPIGQV